MENITIVFITLIVFSVYLHRVVIMLFLYPITSWTTKMHNSDEDRRTILNRIATKYNWWFERLFLYWIGQIHSHHIRNFFYKYAHRLDLGQNAVIYAGAEIRNPSGLKIGKGTIIGDNAILDARAGIDIGENVNFSSNVRIWTLQHDYRDPNFACNPDHYGPVKIGNRAWIGPHSIILRNVTIGEGAVVAAGSVVTHDVQPYDVVGGDTCKSNRKKTTESCIRIWRKLLSIFVKKHNSQNGHNRPKYIITKIEKNLSILVFAIKVFVKIDKEYGIFLLKFFFKQKMKIVSPQDWMNKHSHVKRILHEIFDSYLSSMKDLPIYPIQSENKSHKESLYDDSIWIYWDNPNNIPDLVKCCISSVRKYSDKKKIIIVNEQNYSNYIRVNSNILGKYRAGIISRTHFSDIVRVSLLEKYGGVYMDATILQTQRTPNYVTSTDFFTFKLKIEKPWEVVSNGEWSVFFISCKKQNLLMKATLSMMNSYWEKYDLLIDYLWMDYFWKIASEKIPSIKKMLSDVPYTNPYILSLKDFDIKCSNREYIYKISHNDTAYYKMSFKGIRNIPYKDIDGNTTLLGRIIENNRID